MKIIFFSNFFNYLSTSLLCESFLESAPAKTKSSSTSHIFSDMSWIRARPEIEQFADFSLVAVPNNTWSILSINNLIVFSIILILSLPLFYCLIILIFFLRNQIITLQLGFLSKFEDKNINFSVLTKNHWRILWMYAYNLLPRHSSFFPNLNSDFSWKNLLKYPNPKAVLNFFRHVFLNWHRPRYLPYAVYTILLFVFLLFSDFKLLTIMSMSYGLAVFLEKRRITRWWSLGLIYHKKIIYNLKKKANKWDDFYETMHLRGRFTFYPIFLSFILFLLTTLLVVYMYVDFFFNPILTWNGYFSNTIFCFFLTDLNAFPRINSSIVIDYFIALDGLNIWLIWLTSLLVFLCTLYLLDTVKIHSFLSQLGWIYLLAFASFQFFCVPNYLWMYIYFELSLLPIFILIIFWGSNRWKVHAAYQMVLFTFIGSLFLLAGIFSIYIKIGTFNTFDIFYVTQSPELNIIFSSFEKKLIWLLLFIGFAVKTPLYPFHIWLPEAHSEAPTTGSVMLAGVLLKMGTYGFLRFVMPLFPSVLESFKTLVFTMCLSGILLSSLAALAQIDIKKIIAYSSIGHMGLVIIGIYTLNMNGLLGASYMMLSHGLISSALFFSIGLLYKIYGTRSIVYYSSIAHFMPRFSMCFFIFSLANMSFPGTAGFPGELLIFTSMMADNFFLSILVGVGSIFGGVYSIWLLTWVLYGQISPKISTYRDLKPSERKILNFLVILILSFGIFPFLILDFLKPMCAFYVNLSNL